MKKLDRALFLLFMFLFIGSANAQENCNPDYNTVITGVPYCKDTGVQTTQTMDPDKINNAIQVEDDTNSNINPNIYVYPNINPQPVPPGPLPPAPLYNTPNYGLNQQPYLNNNTLQYLPNTPQDLAPVEIPGTNQYDPYYDNNYYNPDLPQY